MARLTKRDAEALMALIDREPRGVLSRMLAKVLDSPDASWDELVTRARFDGERARRLLAHERNAFYELAPS